MQKKELLLVVDTAKKNNANFVSRKHCTIRAELNTLFQIILANNKGYKL